MDVKVKSTPKTKELLKQMQAELRELQEIVQGARANPSLGEVAAGNLPTGNSAVQLIVQTGNNTPKWSRSFSETRIQAVGNESAAAIGSAVSSPQRIALLRALLGVPDGVSAASLSSAAGLTTGSLYHHLHDLTHAHLVRQSARSHYVLTDKGRIVLLTMLALAA